jgi:hypothetical protein
VGPLAVYELKLELELIQQTRMTQKPLLWVEVGKVQAKCLNLARTCGWTFSLGVWSASVGCL